MADIKCRVRVPPPLPGNFVLRSVQKLEGQEPMRPKPPPPPAKKSPPPRIAPKPIPRRPTPPVDPSPAPPSAPPIEEPNRRKPLPPTKSLLQPQGLAQSVEIPSAPSLDEPDRCKQPLPPRIPPPPTNPLKPRRLGVSVDPEVEEANRSMPPPPPKNPPPPRSSLSRRRKGLSVDQSLKKLNITTPPPPPKNAPPPRSSLKPRRLPHPVDPPRVPSSLPPFEEPDRPTPPVPTPGSVNGPPPVASRRRMLSAIPEYAFDTDKIVGLGVDNFEDFTQRVGKSLVLFYDPGKRNNAELINEFAVAAEMNRESQGNFGAVDCFEERQLCYREGACRTPMLKLFSDGFVMSCIKEASCFKASQMQQLMKMVPPMIFQPVPNVHKPVTRRKRDIFARILGRK